MKTLKLTPIQTQIYRPATDLVEFIVSSIPRDQAQEKMVLAITSKIVSLAEKRVVSRDSISKTELVQKEADFFLGEVIEGCFLTVKDGLLIPSAGIDESNSEDGSYILYPENSAASAQRLRAQLKARWSLKDLGILITDSHPTPLRRGVVGVSLAQSGFQPIRNLIGEKDLFGRSLSMTTMNLSDGLAAAAVFAMGEGAESIPLVCIYGANLEFGDQYDSDSISMPAKEDLFGPLLAPFLK